MNGISLTKIQAAKQIALATKFANHRRGFENGILKWKKQQSMGLVRAYKKSKPPVSNNINTRHKHQRRVVVKGKSNTQKIKEATKSFNTLLKSYDSFTDIQKFGIVYCVVHCFFVPKTKKSNSVFRQLCITNLRSFAKSINQFCDANDSQVVLLDTKLRGVPENIAQMSKIIHLCTQNRDSGWKKRFYTHVYDNLFPQFEKYGLIKFSTLPLTPNNCQYLQIVAGASDHNWTVVRRHLNSYGKILPSYHSCVNFRQKIKLHTGTTSTIKLPVKHKQLQKDHADKQCQVKSYAMFQADTKEGISHGIEKHINKNDFFNANILGKNTIKTYQGADRAQGSYIASVSACTTLKSASSKNGVPTIIVAGDCDDGPEANRLIQENTRHQDKEINQLFQWPSVVVLMKYSENNNTLNSRHACVSTVTLDTKAQIYLDKNYSHLISNSNQIYQPSKPQLSNAFFDTHDEEMGTAPWEKSLSLYIYLSKQSIF